MVHRGLGLALALLLTGCHVLLPLASQQPGEDARSDGSDGPASAECPGCAADACVGKPDGEQCVGAAGQPGRCHAGLCCTGCVSNSNTCVDGDPVQQCGLGGKSCINCNTMARPGNCMVWGCVTGSCTSVPVPDETLCPGGKGKCYGGICCTGCYDKVTMKCLPGTDPAACGSGGDFCTSCPVPADSCSSPLCSSGTCGLTSSPVDGTPCPGAPGKCYGGVCCTGCWDGTTCLLGTDIAACGTGGEICINCSKTGCQVGSCQVGTCAVTPAADGTLCPGSGPPGGTCHGGSCCTGCLDTSGKCQPGDLLTICGDGGSACADCSWLPPIPICTNIPSGLYHCVGGT